MAAKRQTKPKAEAAPAAPPWVPRPGTEWRVRPLSGEGPHKWPRPAYYTADDFDAEVTADGWVREGVPCIVEMAVPYGYRAPTPLPLPMAELAHAGLAEQRPGNVWHVSPEGHRRLVEHARGPGRG